MRRIYNIYTVMCVTLAAFALQGCQQPNNPGPDDGYVLKPYALFIVDDMGQVYSTTDGERFRSWTGTGGLPARSIYTSGHRVLWIAQTGTDLHVSEPDTAAGENLNSNPSYKFLNLAAVGPSAVISLPGFNDTPQAGARDRVYVASGSGKPVAWNDYNGNPDSVWIHEDGADGLTVSSVTSFAQLPNKKVFAYDDATRSIFVKENISTKWASKQGNGLPAAGTPTYLTTKGSDLVVATIKAPAGSAGIWVSNDEGDNFTKQPDIVSGGNVVSDITSVTGAFGKVLIAATESNGIWRLGGQGTWEPTFGLKEGTVVHAIMSKYNVFKSEQKREYIYAATNTGLYRSDDLGLNWIRLDLQINTTGLDPEFVAIH